MEWVRIPFATFPLFLAYLVQRKIGQHSLHFGLVLGGHFLVQQFRWCVHLLHFDSGVPEQVRRLRNLAIAAQQRGTYSRAMHPLEVTLEKQKRLVLTKEELMSENKHYLHAWCDPLPLRDSPSTAWAASVVPRSAVDPNWSPLSASSAGWVQTEDWRDWRTAERCHRRQRGL